MSTLLLRALSVLTVCIVALPVGAQQQASTSIEKLLSEGWEVAGYISAFENRSLVLFKHKEHKYLVQCSILIDVMRNPRVVTYCHEIR